MINIYLIEDEAHIRNYLLQYIRNIINNFDGVEVNAYDSAEDFLKNAEIEAADIVLCDIEMPKMNGIELGRMLKMDNQKLYLVYLTAYPEYAAESYTINAEQYILKKDIEERLEDVLSQLIKRIRDVKEQYILLEANGNVHKIYLNKIIYITKDKQTKYIHIKTEDEEIKKRSTLEEFLKQVNSKRFVVIDRSVVVNINHIVKIDKNKVYLDNGEEKVISRSRLSAVKDAINIFWGGEL